MTVTKTYENKYTQNNKLCIKEPKIKVAHFLDKTLHGCKAIGKCHMTGNMKDRVNGSNTKLFRKYNEKEKLCL